MEGDAEVVKVLALSGQGLPAASATDVALCAIAEYRAAPKKCPASRRAPGAADPEQADDGRRAASQPPAAPARRRPDAPRWTVRAFPRDSARAVARTPRPRPPPR